MEYYETRESAQSKANVLGTVDLALVSRIEALTVSPSALPTGSSGSGSMWSAAPVFPGIVWSGSLDLCSSKKAYSFSVFTHRSTLHLAALNESDLLSVLHHLSQAVYGSVVFSGWIRRQEGISRKWRRRYGALNEYHQLKWYKDEGRSKYLGFIDVDTLSSVSKGKRTATLCELDLYTKYGNVWYLGFEDEIERESWNEQLTAMLPEQQRMGHFVYSETSETMMEGDGDHEVGGHLIIGPPPPFPTPSSSSGGGGGGTGSSQFAPYRVHRERKETEALSGMDIADDDEAEHIVEPINGTEQSAETEPEPSSKPKRESAAKSSIFGKDMVFEAKCKSVRKCHSVQRLIECMHIWNGNGDEERINELLSENGHFSADYEHILKWHLDSKNEFQTLYKHILKHIRHVDLHWHRELTLPDESKQNTFYVNAMYVIHCYFFGNLV